MANRSSRPRRPRDVNERAKLIVDIATAQMEDSETNDKKAPKENSEERKEPDD